MCCKSHAIEFSCQAFCLPTEPSHLVSHVSAVPCVSYSSEWGWGWYKGYQKKQYFFFSPSSNDYGSLWGECHTSAIYITVFQKQCCLWLCNYLINTQYSLHFNLFYFISKYGQAAHVLSTYYIYIGIGVYVCLSVTRYFSTEMQTCCMFELIDTVLPLYSIVCPPESTEMCFSTVQCASQYIIYLGHKRYQLGCTQ